MTNVASIGFNTIPSEDYLPWFNRQEDKGKVSTDTTGYEEGESIEGVLEEDKLKTKIKIDQKIIQLCYQILSVSLSQRWIDEGIFQPTAECKKLATNVVLKLYNEYDIYPTRISATVEEGIFIKYVNYINKKELSIEIYNDLDIASLVTKDKEIITSKDIVDESFSEMYRIFQEE